MMSSPGPPLTPDRFAVHPDRDRALLAIERSDRFEPAACRWLSVLLLECGSLTLDDVQLALACLRSLPAGDVDPIRETLQALAKRRHRLRGQ